MTSVQTRIDKELYNQLQAFAFKKHKNFRSAKTELDEAVKEYLAKQDQEKEN